MQKIATALVILAMAKQIAAEPPVRLAQIPFEPGQMSQGRVVRLEDQLTFGLHATRADQRNFLRKVAEGVEKGNLERARVNAVYKWALLRNDRYPFPYFERAIRLEANKKNVTLPPVQLIITSLGQAG